MKCLICGDEFEFVDPFIRVGHAALCSKCAEEEKNIGKVVAEGMGPLRNAIDAVEKALSD